jgi:hypothetical protein
MTSRGHASSGACQPALTGSSPCPSASAVTTSSSNPDASSACPCTDLVELTGTCVACAPRARRRAAASAASLCGVPVALALT